MDHLTTYNYRVLPFLFIFHLPFSYSTSPTILLPTESSHFNVLFILAYPIVTLITSLITAVSMCLLLSTNNIELDPAQEEEMNQSWDPIPSPKSPLPTILTATRTQIPSLLATSSSNNLSINLSHPAPSSLFLTGVPFIHHPPKYPNLTHPHCYTGNAPSSLPSYPTWP